MTFPKIAILISGTGSNMESIVKACKTGELKAEVTFVGSSSSSAKGLQTAASYGIDTCVFNYKSLEREKAEKEIKPTLSGLSLQDLCEHYLLRSLSVLPEK